MHSSRSHPLGLWTARLASEDMRARKYLLKACHSAELKPVKLSSAEEAICFAGTFLYASCIHILPEIIGERQSLSLVELGAVLAGGILPIVFAALHGDHHH